MSKCTALMRYIRLLYVEMNELEHMFHHGLLDEAEYMKLTDKEKVLFRKVAPPPAAAKEAGAAPLKEPLHKVHPGVSCDKSGIYADQSTGCQVFHFCQEDGRMDSFFCPNLTLFNQRFFVCDWSYNVDCGAAHEFYHLNDGLHLPAASPRHISEAVQPASIVRQQAELLSGAASAQVLQLDASPSPDIVVGDTSAAQHGNQPRSGKAILEEEQHTDPSSPPPSPPPPTPSPAPADLSPNTDTVDSLYYNDVADPEPAAGYDSDLAAVYDADAADPEPAGYYSSADSELGALSAADSDAGNVYTSDAADPEPAGYYSSVESDVATVYDAAVADPEPAGYYSSAGSDLTGVYAVDGDIAAVYDADVADPEPAGYYSSVDSDIAAVYDADVADPEPAGYYSAVDSDVASVYDADVADPEPAGYYDTADPEPAAYYDAGYGDPAPGYYTGYDAAADPEPGYDPYYADPEPGADPEYYASY